MRSRKRDIKSQPRLTHFMAVAALQTLKPDRYTGLRRDLLPLRVNKQEL